MKDLRYVYNVKSNEEIMKHLIKMNQAFDFEQVYSDINKYHSSATVITPDKHMSVAFDYYTSPGGHAGITNLMLGCIYPDYQGYKLYGDERVYFDNLDKNVFILTMKSFLIIFVPSIINDYQYEQITNYVNKLKETEYAKSGAIKSVFINDDEFPFKEIDENIGYLKNNIHALPIPEEFPFDKISSDKDLANFLNIYYHHKRR